MNTPTSYQRRLDRTLPEPPVPAQAEPADPVVPLAVHRDPSLRETSVAPVSGDVSVRVAWIRPSELPTVVGSTVAGRGIDLQAELTRRARHGVASSIAKAPSHNTHNRFPGPDQSPQRAVNQNGLEL